MSIGDGYVGMNINPRMAGRQAGFDHFGIQVEDVEVVRERVIKKYPKIEIVKRPSKGRSRRSEFMIPPASISISHNLVLRTALRSMKPVLGEREASILPFCRAGR